MKERFRSKRFNNKNLDLLQNCISILKKFDELNMRMTLRMLHYQLVSRNIIQNTKKEYKRISRVLTGARYYGLVDWDAIEDRIRIPHQHAEFDNISHLVEVARRNYRLNRWKKQDYYVEVFTEKDALSSILMPIIDKWHVFLNVLRGYSSATALYKASKRFIENNDKTNIALYFGDHDPSGLDMIRDVKDRLTEFGCIVTVIPIALTIEQVKKYNLPPNYAKIKDSRSKNYIMQFGKASWEVDALPPDVMTTLIDSAIKHYVDIEKMTMVKKQEIEDMKQLEGFAKQLGGDDVN
ncbi:MAG: hypothetical protein K8R68_09555 [Bacteroidales bacterium]|nr:hypothetical protein [Bacteroidales bacterium]